MSKTPRVALIVCLAAAIWADVMGAGLAWQHQDWLGFALFSMAAGLCLSLVRRVVRND